MKDNNWRYCVVGNVVKTRYDKDGNLRYGTKPFCGGKKLYISKNARFEEDEVVVMGINRFNRYDLEWIPITAIENVRRKRVYKPKVLWYMNDPEYWALWWDNTEEDEKDSRAFVKAWKENAGKKDAN